MAREQSLWERLRDAAAGGPTDRYGSVTTEDPEALMESVQGNLARLLNARHGMCESAPDFGLPAMMDLIAGNDEYVRRVQEAIRVAIEKYEPRLRRVRVAPAAEQGAAHKLVFRVEGVLVGKRGEHRVWYETAISPTGRFQVVG